MDTAPAFTITDHDTNEIFTAYDTIEIVAHYWHTFAQEDALTPDMKAALHDLENGTIDNTTLREVLGITIATSRTSN